jgi:chromosome segregation ATPase
LTCNEQGATVGSSMTTIWRDTDMTDEISIGESLVGQKLPRDAELIITTFLPNLRHLESRFDQTDLNIKDLSIGVKDTNNRLIALEKRMDYFEVQVDKRFEQMDKRFEQVDKRFEQVDRRFEQVDRCFEQVDRRFELVDKRFDQVTGELKDFKSDVNRRFELVDKRFDQLTGELKDFKVDVSRHFEQIAASIERMGDKLDVRDARQRSFTLQMFGIAISVSFLGALGILAKSFGII